MKVVYHGKYCSWFRVIQDDEGRYWVDCAITPANGLYQLQGKVNEGRFKLEEIECRNRCPLWNNVKGVYR